MKKSVLCICIFMVALTVLAWFSQISNIAGKKADFKENVALAEGFIEEGLYQKAIDAYEKALKIKEDESARKALIETGKIAVADGVIPNSDLTKIIEAACDVYPENVELREELLSHYLDTQNYTKAHKAYNDCLNDEITSDNIKSLGNKIKYLYTVGGKAYTDYIRTPNGYATVADGEEWGVVDPAGERIIDCDYAYISPYNLDCSAVFVTDKDARLINKDNVVEKIVKADVVNALAYGDNLLPVCNEDGEWRYLNCESGKYELGTYDAASSFKNGIAAVCKDGKWTLINTKNEKVCETSFDDVKLHDNGDYVYKDVMIASVDGKYGIYDAKGKALCDFKSVDMDVYCGGDIAYCSKDGKWGFVDTKGKETIKAQYENAKSFSNTLAGVCKDGKWGYIDKNNILVIENQFIEAGYFSNKGVCFVSLGEGEYQLLKIRFFEK